MTVSPSPAIGTYQEKSLHAALKDWYAAPGDLAEQPVDGYVVDLVRGNELIEIQTRNFSALKRKLATLLQHHSVRLVHPIPARKWIVRLDRDGATVLSRRRSPKRGTLLDVFDELVSIPHLVAHPRFALEVLLVAVEETRQQDGRGSWRRRGWSIHDQNSSAWSANTPSAVRRTSPRCCPQRCQNPSPAATLPRALACAAPRDRRSPTAYATWELSRSSASKGTPTNMRGQA